MAVHNPFIPHGAGAPAAAEPRSRVSSQSRTQALSTSLQNAPSPNHASSAQEGVCKKKWPTSFAPMPPHCLIGRVSWRKMKREMLCPLEPTASSINDIQALLAFPAPCHVKHQKTTCLSCALSPTQSHTGHVTDTPLEITSPYTNGMSASLLYVGCTVWALINSSWPSLPHQQGDSPVHLPLLALTARTPGWRSVTLRCGFTPLSLKRSGARVLQEQVWGRVLCSFIHSFRVLLPLLIQEDNCSGESSFRPPQAKAQGRRCFGFS